MKRLLLGLVFLLAACDPTPTLSRDDHITDYGTWGYATGPNGEKCLLWVSGRGGGMECDTVNYPND